MLSSGKGRRAMIKLDVWSSCSDVNAEWHDIIEIPDNATEKEIESAARETAHQHFEWGYDIIKNGGGNDD
ncbi:hypothetical protein 8014-B2_00104 [Lactobacillus phage ATCC 8014-B2]|uniref:Uncharacterized protein n=1 Tax=Lactobacillus phage ATCC 8014-B2 TaxID=1225795 RepID=K4HZV9_9CAUD|nr:hypothetical protein HOQ89_gp042 [Lactobacillus phage ATCC 8014-B2]AFU63171.1 hypothetical protein 8014-B2_00104 [Lactobacillus phage ATCC 8014-B2]